MRIFATSVYRTWTVKGVELACILLVTNCVRLSHFRVCKVSDANNFDSHMTPAEAMLNCTKWSSIRRIMCTPGNAEVNKLIEADVQQAMAVWRDVQLTVINTYGP